MGKKTAIQILIDHLEMTPPEFAEQIGISRQGLQNLRVGDSVASWETYCAIRDRFSTAIRYCGLEPDDFMGRH